MYSYCREAGFQKELEKALTARVAYDVGWLEGAKREAYEVLGELMRNKDPDIRLKAAKAVVDTVSKREALLMKAFEFRRQDEKNDPLGLWN